jgi:hypothetical protein
MNQLDSIIFATTYNPKTNTIRIPIRGGSEIEQFKIKKNLNQLKYELKDWIKNKVNIAFDFTTEKYDFKKYFTPSDLDEIVSVLFPSIVTFYMGPINCKEHIHVGYEHLIEHKLSKFLFKVGLPANDFNILNERGFIYKFMCPMGKARFHRIKTYDFFKKNIDIENNTLYSFNTRNKHTQYESIWLEDSIKERLDDNHFEQKTFTLENQLIFLQKSFCNIVSETGFTKEDSDIRITEKTLLPIKSLQPFIIIGSYKILKYLKEYGFKTFSDFWDESYDEIEDDELRIETIFKLIKKINKKSLKELKDIYLKMIPILQHNHQNFYNLLNRDDMFIENTLIEKPISDFKQLSLYKSKIISKDI